MVYTGDGFVVRQGSVARQEIAPSVRTELEPKRTELLLIGVLENAPDGLRFKKDHLFKSPSGAAGVVSGTSVNGWDVWIDDRGRSLDEVIRRADEA